MKKRILYIAVIVIVLSLMTGGTLAYYNATDTVRNVITSGKVDVSLIEQQLVDGVLQPYPSDPIKIMPGRTVSKIISVESTEQPAWIRASYKLTVYDANGVKMDISDEELATVIIIEPDASAWTYHEGWWYYNEAVDGGDTTTPLFESVEFSATKMGNQYQRCTMTIDVIAQGVQQANNGESALDAMGWPES